MNISEENFISLLKTCIERIKDELLLFAVLCILLIVSFEQYKLPVFGLFCFGTIAYLVKIFIQTKQSVADNRHFDNFAKYLNNKSKWSKRQIDNDDIYFYQDDNEYKIERAQDSHKTWTATESWMTKFPDSHISEYRVYLKHAETKIYEAVFVSCDGGRYFLPLPRKRLLDQSSKSKPTFEYYWIKNSIEYQLGEIIGEYYRQDSIEEVAKFCEIRILN